MKALLPWWQSCGPSLNSKIWGFLDHVLGNTRCTIQEGEEFTFIKFLLLRKSHLYGLYLTGACVLCLRVEFGQWDALAHQRVWWELEEYILSVSIPWGLSWAVSAFLSLRCQSLLGIPFPAAAGSFQVPVSAPALGLGGLGVVMAPIAVPDCPCPHLDKHFLH